LVWPILMRRSVQAVDSGGPDWTHAAGIGRVLRRRRPQTPRAVGAGKASARRASAATIWPVLQQLAQLLPSSRPGRWRRQSGRPRACRSPSWPRSSSALTVPLLIICCTASSDAAWSGPPTGPWRRTPWPLDVEDIERAPWRLASAVPLAAAASDTNAAPGRGNASDFKAQFGYLGAQESRVHAQFISRAPLPPVAKRIWMPCRLGASMRGPNPGTAPGAQSSRPVGHQSHATELAPVA
jgi:hypothetical protein